MTSSNDSRFRRQYRSRSKPCSLISRYTPGDVPQMDILDFGGDDTALWSCALWSCALDPSGRLSAADYATARIRIWSRTADMRSPRL
ncbi:hypothetical protein B7R22_08985 [Subtercola boreus]|uniref:Uncharacterized protein n=1 Tax=Subtercola boreus TaxID=120213 RepID=A0A3E0VY65_9MICO|nr:hypothetical protein B7R22_08985 [Subtercola boreus]